MISPTRTPLPIDAHIESIQAAVRDRPATLIKAEPGAGKTTRVPAALLPVVAGRILVLEPRRLAARLSAARVAEELGEETGDTVGYRIRLESRVSARTRIIFLTEGVFLRLVIEDPELKGVGAVILDEFHERHLQSDLALAVTRRLQTGKRPDLKLVLMSATLETAALERYLPAAMTFEIPGRTYPVTVVYRPAPAQEPVESAVSAAAGAMLADQRCPGNILVFLTGMQEIQRSAGALTAVASAAGADVLPLAADLTPAEQARVFAPSSRRKIILATNVAETSLTIDGVTGVIDTGRAKIAGHAAWSGMPTLDVRRVSQASCIQRGGRAGRTAPGVVYRLYSEADFRERPPYTPAEIRRLDMTSTCLEVLAFCDRLGAGAVKGGVLAALPWFEAPEPQSVASAMQTLAFLGAVTLADDGPALTRLGAEMAALPLHPRLAAIALKGQATGIAQAALLAACMLNEGMILPRGVRPKEADDCDVHHQLTLLIRHWRREGERGQAPSLDPGTVRRIRSLFELLARRLGVPATVPAAPTPTALTACLLAGFPDRVARRRELPQVHIRSRPEKLYNLCLGRGAVLSDSSVVHDAELIIALDASESQMRSADRGTTIWTASALSPELLGESPSPLLKERRIATWVDGADRIDVVRQQLYGELVIKESRQPVAEADAGAIEELMRSKLKERWPKPFDDDSDLRQYHARAAILAAAHPDRDLGLPRFEGEMLELLQAAIAEGRRSFREVADRSLMEYIREQLPWESARLLDQETPAELELGNGRRLKVRYEEGKPPFVESYIQDFYGLAATPVLPDRRTVVTVHLTGPNRRPIQVTSDLAGFWIRTYPKVRGELARDYPRHHWPEDPVKAPPVLHKSKLGR